MVWLLGYPGNRGKYFANSRWFSAGRVPWNFKILVKFLKNIEVLTKFWRNSYNYAMTFHIQMMTIECVIEKYLIYSNYLKVPNSGSEEFQVSGKAAPEEFVLFREIFTPGKEISRSLGCAPLWMPTRASGSWCSELSLATLGQGVAGAVVSQLFYWQAKKTRVQAVIPSPPHPLPQQQQQII